MENSSCVSSVQRPAELLPLTECLTFADFVLSCYFATHKEAVSISEDELGVFCSKFKVQLEDKITMLPAA